MNPILSMLGQNIFGSLWTTTIGGAAVWSTLMPLIHLLSSGKTFGEIVLSPELAGTVAGIAAIVSPDPHKGAR